ncbi:hypothetical protein N9459_05635 [Flavobacteriaceae bacterium]|nr:hypothetical protein [Flavobacteriaceae bacterium]
MGYKTKSMIKQASGLSANYLLKKELNKYTNSISEQPKQGESIAKSTKKFTTPEILKSKNSARDRDEKKQIRRAGRDAARNTDVNFVKATPMGSDYFSLMAATAENLASRGAGKRKARKAAKSLKREMFSEGRDTKPTEVKVAKKIESKKTTPSSSKEEIKVPKKTDDFKVLPTTPDTLKAERAERLKRGNKALFKKVDENMNAYNQQKNEETKRLQKNEETPTSKEGFTSFTRSEGREDISKDDLKIPKSKTNNVVGKPSGSINDIQRAYIALGMIDKAREAGKAHSKQEMAEDKKLTGTNIPSYLSVSKSEADKFDANLKQDQENKARERESQNQAEIDAAKRTLGIQMTGDGFNKGMSRKNKYKK